MKRNSLLSFLSIAAVLLLLIAACGDDDDEDPTATSPSAGGAPTETRAAGDGGETPDEGGEDGENGGGDLAAMGEELYTAQGCNACHTTDGSQGVGPTWQGLFGSEVTLEGGETVTADADYIKESITDPTAKVHQGFQPIMPAFPNLSDEELDAIVAFIESLS